MPSTGFFSLIAFWTSGGSGVHIRLSGAVFLEVQHRSCQHFLDFARSQVRRRNPLLSPPPLMCSRIAVPAGAFVGEFPGEAEMPTFPPICT